jgi:fumarate reductase subunit D
MNARAIPLDLRARQHAAYWAFLVHRVSGVLLSLFLPLHFLLLATALAGASSLDSWLHMLDRPAIKIAEWGLVVLLSLHLTGGIRLLLIEFRGWRGLRTGWIACGLGVSCALGLAYALALHR